MWSEKGRFSFAQALLLALVAGLAAGCPRGGSPLRSAPTRRRSEPTISVYFHEDKTKRRMKLEEYLLGVVAGEMKKDWPPNAYAAQAILARTFTLDLLSRGGTRRLHQTDICTDERHAQAYNAASITPAIRRAVAATRGLVMFYRSRYVRGWFSASCGGRTAFAREGLAFKGTEPPYISSVVCPEGKVIPRGDQFWQAQFSGAELAAALKKVSGQSIGPVTGVQRAAVSRTTHRTTKLRLVSGTGSAELAAADLRVAIGPERMRSIWLDKLVSERERTIMAGRGFGHGVGLCQWGAHALAKEGKGSKEIVLFYYPKVEIEELW